MYFRGTVLQFLRSFNRKKILIVSIIILGVVIALMGRLCYLMIFQSEYYGVKADDLHERERVIKAARGNILDANGVVLASNETVCTISVIHSQLDDSQIDSIVSVLSEKLGLDEETVREKVEKVSSIEKIKSNVSKEIGDEIRAYEFSGIKVDEDYKRYYPYGDLASKVIGFTGGDNQGIIGLEVMYDEYLQGTDGLILTLADARGVEIENAGETRQEPVDGYDLYTSLDVNIQEYAQQCAETVMEQKSADAVSIIIMNPQNGEIMAMVNTPEFDLNEPFTLNTVEDQTFSDEDKQLLLNQMWRNSCISDTYEPGSTFKVVTTAAAFEAGVVTTEDTFYCPGYAIVEDRKIHCAKTTGHGAETFEQGLLNSCNPVFIEVGLRIGSDRFYDYLDEFGLLDKTGVDLPGEASTIMHNKEDIGQVELATMSFGQSFQVTPLQLITTEASIVNGGIRVTPHIGVSVKSKDGTYVKTFDYDTDESDRIVSSETSETIQKLLEEVVSEGSGNKAYIEGYSIGGKTATSQTLPRSANKYIASFIGFAPADDPQVMALVVIYNPQGVYYGGTIAAPVVKNIFENILPYLGIEKDS